jgi:nucleotide-binding universal stress UspA family protein
MLNSKHILLAIDDLEKSRPLVDYVAQLADGGNDFKVHLFHALGPLPPQLMESPGAENARAEERVEQKQAGQQDAWLEQARSEFEPQLENEKARLSAANVPEIEIHLPLLNQRTDLVPEIVKAARDNDCGMIVVGQNSYSWLWEQFHAHLSEQLLSECPESAVCVVCE